jgi:rubrerythrin
VRQRQIRKDIVIDEMPEYTYHGLVKPLKTRNRENNMEETKASWICTECGFTSSKRFPEDICPKCGVTYWMCDECGFTIVSAYPPSFCPECEASCNFTNITCYIPDMGTPDITDMQ